jgi:hypothetical protein
MPKTKISEFSATPANNTDIDSINIAEGCAPSGINDAIRELMSQLKDFQTGAAGDSFNGPVGSTTAAAGAFTTLSATSTLSVTGAGSIQGLTVGRGAGAVATNTVFGASALSSNTTGANNLALGVNALGSNTTASFNVAVGGAAIFANTTGNRVVAVGYNAAYNNTTGVENTAIGHDAFSVNTTGSNNVVVGRSALSQNTTASYNTAVGYQAAYSNTTGAFNTVVGLAAGYTNTTGNYNTYVGWSAGYSSTGTQNTFIGQGAGYYITSGTQNTIIGGYAGNQGGLDIRTSSGFIVLSDGAGNPRGVFNSSGTFLTGKADASVDVNGHRFDADGSSFTSISTGNETHYVRNSTAAAYRFYVNAAGTVFATNTTISAISDIRYKENVRDLDAGLAEVMALKPRLYDWKEGKGVDIKNARGFIAQEFETVFPDLIDTWKDPAPEGEEPYKSIRADLIPVLVKAIQELNTKFEAYKASHP